MKFNSGFKGLISDSYQQLVYIPLMAVVTLQIGEAENRNCARAFTGSLEYGVLKMPSHDSGAGSRYRMTDMTYHVRRAFVLVKNILEPWFCSGKIKTSRNVFVHFSVYTRHYCRHSVPRNIVLEYNTLLQCNTVLQCNTHVSVHLGDP